jgi:hypothetical protein
MSPHHANQNRLDRDSRLVRADIRWRHGAGNVDRGVDLMANKYLYLYVIQGCYGQGWEDETAEDNRWEARVRLREYRDNMPEYSHRIIRRRELIGSSSC